MTLEAMNRSSLIEERLDAIRLVCPEAFRDGELDFSVLRDLLGDHCYEGVERYGLSWPGQKDSRRHASRGATATLRFRTDMSSSTGKSRDTLLVGDNLEILKVIRASYSGRIKLIYIDPPYNTGHDLVYNDRFDQSEDSFLEETGQRDTSGALTSNPKASGRFHSKWLSMLAPRIRQAKPLLTEDGIICVSIDDGEAHNLRHLMDDVFGPENFIGQLVWKSRVSEDARTTSGLSSDHEYIVCYRASEFGRLRGAEKDLNKFKNPDSDPRGPWRSADLTGLASKEKRPNLHYDLINPKTGIVYPCPPKGWRWERATMASKIEAGEVIWPSDPSGRPRHKLFLQNMKSDFKGLSSVILSPSTADGTREIRNLVGDNVFQFSKPSDLISSLIEQVTDSDSEDLILDFFAGSGTTGTATWKRNLADGGNRRFVLVQIAEPTSVPGFKTIDQVTRARLAASATALDPDRFGFETYEVTRSNVVRWRAYEGTKRDDLGDLFASHSGLVSGWKAEDVVVELMLENGYPLDADRTQDSEFVHNTVWRVTHAFVPVPLLVCLDEALSDETIEALPDQSTFICLETALTDSQKISLADAVTRVRTI